MTDLKRANPRGRHSPSSYVCSQEYLYNVFCDPEIVTLPQYLGFLKSPLAWFIAKSRAAEVSVFSPSPRPETPPCPGAPHP